MFKQSVIFSNVEGIVTEKGVPVAGAEIIQEVTYQEPGKIPTRTIQTEADGRFTLEPIMVSAGFSTFIPGQPSVLQRLLIRHNGVEYEGWRHNKNSYELNSELDGQPLKLVCELTNTPDFEGKHYGVCRAQ